MCAKHYRNCPTCNQDFSAPKNKQVYCSRSCRNGKPSENDSERHYCFSCGILVVGRKLGKSRTGKDCEKMFCSRSCYDSTRANYIEDRKEPCAHCNKPIDTMRYGAKHKSKYCSHKCRVADKKGRPLNCVNCGCLFSAVKTIMRPNGVTIISVNDAKTCSSECHNKWIRTNPERKDKISKAFTGDKHPNWNGGTHRIGNRGPGWLRIAEKCRDLHGRKCKHCGMTEDASIAQNWGRLQVNHIVPFHQWQNKRKANAQSNLEALCKSCHTKADWAWKRDNPVQHIMNLFE